MDRERTTSDKGNQSREYRDVMMTVVSELSSTIDMTQLAKLEAAVVREEIHEIVSEIICLKNVVMSIAGQEALVDEICSRFGPFASPCLPPEPTSPKRKRSDSAEYFGIKTVVFNALIDIGPIEAIVKLGQVQARTEIRELIAEIIERKGITLSIAEHEEMLEDLCNHVIANPAQVGGLKS